MYSSLLSKVNSDDPATKVNKKLFLSLKMCILIHLFFACSLLYDLALDLFKVRVGKNASLVLTDRFE